MPLAILCIIVRISQIIVKHKPIMEEVRKTVLVDNWEGETGFVLRTVQVTCKFLLIINVELIFQWANVIDF